MRVGGWLIVMLASLGVPAVAAAQDTGQKGITMGYPESVGLVWHVTGSVAVRPEFAFAHATTKTNLPFVDDNLSSTSVGAGVSALFYLSDVDHLRPYIAPRWTYTHSDPGGGPTSHTNTVAGLFGAQYALGKRFSVFGETGVSFGHSTLKSDVSVLSAINPLTTHANSVGTTTGAGVIFYF